jgi:hypothetical protein
MEEAAPFEVHAASIRSGVACTVGVDFFYAAVRFVLAQEEPAELLLSNLADYHRTQNFEPTLEMNGLLECFKTAGLTNACSLHRVRTFTSNRTEKG